MNGRELERLFSLLEDGTREEVMQYVRDNREQILRELRDNGEAHIPVSGQSPLVLRPAA
jgi:hypothetical protein